MAGVWNNVKEIYKCKSKCNEWKCNGQESNSRLLRENNVKWIIIVF